MYDEDLEPEQNELQEQPCTPMAISRRQGRVLPLTILVNALGKQLERFQQAPAFCALVTVKSIEWVTPFTATAKILADWDVVVESDLSARDRDRLLSDAVRKLATGARVLCVAPALTPASNRLLPFADLVIELDSLTKRDVTDAIHATTGFWPRGLRTNDLVGITLEQAIAAIRHGTSAASCVRRLRASRAAPSADPLAAAAPLETLCGYGAAQEWAGQLVADLERWRAGDIELSQIQRNAVLAGPPGVGKSTFVRSLAKSARVPLFTSSMGTLFGSTAGYLDSIVKGIDSLFNEASNAAKCSLVFIDELEGIPSRINLDNRHASWWTPVVNHFLTTLDSALSPAATNLIIVGATNFPERLDPALTRPGRLDRVIWIDPPDEKALVGIYRQHLGQELAGESLDGLAAITVGCTGADVVGHIKGARARARAQARPLRLQDIVEEICPPSNLGGEDLWRVCLHECGHAIAALRLGTGSIKSITATGSGRQVGRVVYEHTKLGMGNAERQQSLVIQLLSGRAAEEVLLGSVSTGAGGSLDSDLAKASGLVAASHLSWGLRGSLLFLAEPEKALAATRLSPRTLRAMEQELSRSYELALQLVRENATIVRFLARHLREERVLSGDRFMELVSSHEEGRADDDA